MFRFHLLCLLLALCLSVQISMSMAARPSKRFTGVMAAALNKGDANAKKDGKKNSAKVVAKGNDNEEPTLNAFDLCIAGSVATALGDLSLHPIDTIKTTQQTSEVVESMFAVAKKIWKTSGLKGFYPGVVPYVAGDGLSGAVKFASFELSKSWLFPKVDKKYHNTLQFVCAAGAFIACSVILVPGEVLKTRLQAGTVTNLFQGITSIIKEDGFGGLFAGYAATLFRDVPYTMLELGLYENIKTFMRKRNAAKATPIAEGKSTPTDEGELSTQQELTAAAITGAFTGWATTPLDVIKTKLMMQSTSGGQYKGVVDAFKQVYKTGGMDALFVGAPARVAWLLPFTTIYLGFYEVVKREIITMKKSKQ